MGTQTYMRATHARVCWNAAAHTHMDVHIAQALACIMVYVCANTCIADTCVHVTRVLKMHVYEHRCNHVHYKNRYELNTREYM